MSEKTCFKCLKTLPFDSFYKHSKMTDVRLNKCIACTKRDVNKHRQENLEKVRAYDRFRGGLAHRVAARKEYAKTDAYKESHKKSLKKNYESSPDKRKARYLVANAVRDGMLFKVPCRDCGSYDVEGHHPDYSKPLFVIWLCDKHHKAEHKRLRDINRASQEAKTKCQPIRL